MRRFDLYERFLEVQIERSDDIVLFYDNAAAINNASIKEFVDTFPNRVPLEGGEDLKTLTALVRTIENVLVKFGHIGRNQMHFVCLGGGSVCDFVGLLASIWKRGVKLTLIPSTWLAAIDSAHGGKNGINVLNVKNQVGTFYFPHQVLLVREAFESLSPDLVRDALFEMLKIFLIRSEIEFQKLETVLKVSETWVWDHLEEAINLKWQIVDEDPQEKTGQRSLLNFGHTFGHVVESYHGYSHGLSVGIGMRFALELSVFKNICTAQTFNRAVAVLDRHLPQGFRQLAQVGKAADLLSRVKMDKKNQSVDSVRFVLLAEVGDAIPIEVGIDELIQFSTSNGWVVQNDRL